MLANLACWRSPINCPVLVLLSIFVCFKAWGHTIEDGSLVSIDSKVEAPVLKSSTFSVFRDLKCKIVGAKVAGLGQKQIFFMTTGNACGWGANIGPVWLVLKNGASYKLALSTSGYGFSISDDIKKVLVWSEWGGHRVEKSYFITRDEYVEK